MLIMDCIRLDHITLFAHHGVAMQERELGQRFYMDIELYGDLTKAAESDDLKEAINYEQVYEVAEKVFRNHSYNLLEAAALAVIRALFEHFPVERISVELQKPAVPIDGVLDAVVVRMTRNREEVLPA